MFDNLCNFVVWQTGLRLRDERHDNNSSRVIHKKVTVRQGEERDSKRTLCSAEIEAIEAVHEQQ